MPTLFILAGPNGVGKTTYYNTALSEGFIQPTLPFINADNIVRDELGTYSEENYAKAEFIVRERIKLHTELQRDFMIESNLAQQREYDWITNMKAKTAYEVVVYFLYTESVLINLSRVQKRIKEGGHNVAEAIIRHRYAICFSYLKLYLFKFEKAYLIDNTEKKSALCAITQKGVLTFKNPNCPNWVNEILYLTEKLKRGGC